MTVEQMTARINELYHKSQAEGLSEAEKEEQSRLRQAYVANVRANLRGQLNQISIVEKDGSITNLGDKKSKDSVRIRSLKRRDALTKQDRTRYSQEIVQQVITLSCYQEADILLAYASYRSEVETYGLIRQALSDNKLVFVPRVEGQDMEFYVCMTAIVASRNRHQTAPIRIVWYRTGLHHQTVYCMCCYVCPGQLLTKPATGSAMEAASMTVIWRKRRFTRTRGRYILPPPPLPIPARYGTRFPGNPMM